MEDVKSKTNGHSEIVADAHGLDLSDMTDDELLQIGIGEGINWSSPGRQSDLEDVIKTARKINTPKPNRIILGLQSFFVSLGELVLMVVMLFIKNMLMPLSMLGLIGIEIMRVEQGWALFDSFGSLVASSVIVMFSIGFLFARFEDDGDAEVGYAYYSIVAVIMVLGTAGVTEDETEFLPVALSFIANAGLYIGLAKVAGYNYANYKRISRFLAESSSVESVSEVRRKWMIVQIQRNRKRKRQQSR